MILPWLILLFIVVPLTELMLLIWLGGKIGTLTTIGIVVFTGILGATLARAEGVATWRRFQLRMGSGELPHEDLVDGLLILIAGAVLLTPGFLTDAAGFLLLVPSARAVVRRSVVRRLMRRVVMEPPMASYPGTGGAASPGPVAAEDIVDADYTVEDADPEDGA